MKPIIAFSILAAFLITSTGAFAGGGTDVAIVVNKANKLDTISSRDLKQIFSGDKTRWPDGSKVQTLAPSAVMPEHKAAIEFLFGMSEPDYQKYCIHANFVGEPQKVVGLRTLGGGSESGSCDSRRSQLRARQHGDARGEDSQNRRQGAGRRRVSSLGREVRFS